MNLTRLFPCLCSTFLLLCIWRPWCLLLLFLSLCLYDNNCLSGIPFLLCCRQAWSLSLFQNLKTRARRGHISRWHSRIYTHSCDRCCHKLLRCSLRTLCRGCHTYSLFLSRRLMCVYSLFLSSRQGGWLLSLVNLFCLFCSGLFLFFLHRHNTLYLSDHLRLRP